MRKDLTWTYEELILVLDSYMKAGRHPLQPENEEVQRLSHLLRGLTIHPVVQRKESFRSPDSVAMKVKEFAVLDHPDEYAAREHKAKLQEYVWDAYYLRPKALHRMAEAVVQTFIHSEKRQAEDEEA